MFLNETETSFQLKYSEIKYQTQVIHTQVVLSTINANWPQS